LGKLAHFLAQTCSFLAHFLLIFLLKLNLSLFVSKTGPGFRLSETQPVRVLKQLEDWFPFFEEDEFPGSHDEEKRSVS
jgi:hypothetical protein